MTENKRFTYMEQLNGFCDVYDNGEVLSCMRLEYVGKTVELLNNLNDENKQIKHTIHEAYNHERTALGKSVLKQILDNVEAIK